MLANRDWSRGLRLSGLCVALALIITAVLAPRPVAAANTLKTLYTFCLGGGTCTDGCLDGGGCTNYSRPSPLIMGKTGNFYGVAGGGLGYGVVFEISPDSSGKIWTEKVLYTFCPKGGICADGSYPIGALFMDSSGNLYGTTNYGGRACDAATSCGVVFELLPDGKKWHEKVLYDFCSKSNCTDGYIPEAGLVMDKSGILYGTTTYGGNGTGNPTKQSGTVFQLTRGAAGKRWTEKVLYNFCAKLKCADGAAPQASLILDKAGNLYGVTTQGGVNCDLSGIIFGCGVVFKLSLNTATSKWTESILYSLCSKSDCLDGSSPGSGSGVIQDNAGNLYGTTTAGGTHCSPGCGTVFELVFDSSTKKYKEKVIHEFCAKANCTDGHAPQGGVFMDAKGNLYVTTNNGGSTACNCGTAFKLLPASKPATWTANILYRFCAQIGCTDGEYPVSGMLVDQHGDIYGATSNGGNTSQCNGFGCGTAFEIKP